MAYGCSLRPWRGTRARPDQLHAYLNQLRSVGGVFQLCVEHACLEAQALGSIYRQVAQCLLLVMGKNRGDVGACLIEVPARFTNARLAKCAGNRLTMDTEKACAKTLKYEGVHVVSVQVAQLRR